MKKCPACGAERSPEATSCASCGASFGAGEPKEFQSLGAIKLKKAKRGADGALTETVESSDAAPSRDAPGEGGKKKKKKSKDGELVNELETDLLAQMNDASLAAGESFIAGSRYLTGRAEEGTKLVGAPPLSGKAPLLEVIRAAPSRGSGFLSTLIYAIKAPRVAGRQRVALAHMGSELAKYKKMEGELLAALGRAARMNDLAPPECASLVETVQEQEMTGLEQRLKADEVLEAKSEAEAEYQKKKAAAESKLASLELQHHNMVNACKELEQEIADSEARIDLFRKREQELRNASAQGDAEGDAARRVQEYEQVKAQRKIIEVELNELQGKLDATRRPIGRIRDEIAEVRRGLEAAAHRREVAVKQAQAAEVSGERREAYTNRTVAEIDEEIGRTIANLGQGAPQLQQLLLSNEACRRLTAHWNGLVGEQQAELDRFDEKRARNGFWMLVGGLLGVLFAILGIAEILRRVLVDYE